MSASQEITLGRLQVVRMNGGIPSFGELKILQPSPCVQPNAPGTLSKCEGLEGFAQDAKARGAAFRASLAR